MSPASEQHDPGGKSRPAWPIDSTVSARFSDCGQYRYELAEIWDNTKPLVLWILMNPSVACLDYSDPTLRKTGIFSRAWGYGGQLIGNVHAYRATDKKRLLDVHDPSGRRMTNPSRPWRAEPKPSFLLMANLQNNLKIVAKQLPTY